MPIYEYECEKCKERFELLRGISESGEPAACPKCGAEDARRLMSLFGSSGCGSSGDSCSLTAST
ncbi:MAG: zinc ribbon domain-containing protein [Candidatus Coatesbacteria bacterium]|nr:zinc ribbon domain-containing protein [Candidatus Coatesbacteria bacterium]